jgi:acyl carrier protein
VSLVSNPVNQERSMDVREQVRQFILTNFYVPDPATVTDEASLLRSGIVDSTGVLEVISFLEETFQVTVDDEEMTPDNLDSILHITAFLDRKRSAPALRASA